MSIHSICVCVCACVWVPIWSRLCHGNEPSGFIQCGGLADNPSCRQLLKMASAPRSYIIIWLEWWSQKKHTEYWLRYTLEIIHL